MSVPGERKRVLIVDDEERVAFFLAETVRAMGKGLSVVSVGSAEEALEQMAYRPFDLLVTDLRMPGMDGLELIRQVQHSYPQTRTILITAYGSEGVEAEVRRLRSAFYLTKPFPVGQFTQAVERALELEPLPSRSTSPLRGAMDVVRRTLTALRRSTGAQCALLADPRGEVVAQVGVTEDRLLEAILPVLAEEAELNARMAPHMGEELGASLHHYEGDRYHLHAAIVPEGFILVVLSRQPAPRRLGTTWLFLRRALRELRALSLGGQGGFSVADEAASSGGSAAVRAARRAGRSGGQEGDHISEGREEES